MVSNRRDSIWIAHPVDKTADVRPISYVELSPNHYLVFDHLVPIGEIPIGQVSACFKSIIPSSKSMLFGSVHQLCSDLELASMLLNDDAKRGAA